MRKPPTRKPRTFKPVTMWAVVMPQSRKHVVNDVFTTRWGAVTVLASRRFNLPTYFSGAYICRVTVSPAKRKVKR